MKLNLEQKRILECAENGTLENIAAEKAARNERNFQHCWTVEQHLEYLQKKAAELKAELAKEAAEMQKKQSSAPRYATFSNYLDADKALEPFGFGE